MLGALAFNQIGVNGVRFHSNLATMSLGFDLFEQCYQCCVAKDDLLEILNLTAEVSELKAVKKGEGAGTPQRLSASQILRHVVEVLMYEMSLLKCHFGHFVP